ncbi:uncharacterized protein C8A04DRAFT_28265 [Dichotomopilus funicola]|uniref:Rhodopsin domain-containing protein n=1 Tax=Dichotomopilus funicola TaxID=1934379 RepID=A0AAN6V336_9PEZI|nr:hypothetical protein C8A04DRAFT_28265 [Dichotomopilus funicola]
MGLPRYDDPAGLVAGTVILQAISITCVGLRFYTKRWKRQEYLVSDWLILSALIFGIGLSVIQIYGIAKQAFGYPLGATIQDPYAVTGRLNLAKHLELAYLLVGIVALGLIKLSICFFYWHLFARVMFRRFLMVWIIVIIIWATAFVLSGLLECGSYLLALFGTPQEYLDHCGSAIPAGYAMVASDILTDFVTLMIPIPVILTLQTSTRTRILTLLTFMIGALSVGASIAKGYIYITATLGLYTEDAISILTGIGIWNLVEVQVGIIAACGPTLRPVLGRIFPGDFASLASMLGLSKLSSKLSSKPSSDQLPSFVKTPGSGSEEKLGRTTSEGGSHRSRESSVRGVDTEHELTTVDLGGRGGSRV